MNDGREAIGLCLARRTPWIWSYMWSHSAFKALHNIQQNSTVKSVICVCVCLSLYIYIFMYTYITHVYIHIINTQKKKKNVSVLVVLSGFLLLLFWHQICDVEGPKPELFYSQRQTPHLHVRIPYLREANPMALFTSLSLSLQILSSRSSLLFLFKRASNNMEIIKFQNQ